MSNEQPESAAAEALMRAGLAGARAILEIYGSDFQVREKSDQSPVCIADELAEAKIIAQLEQDFPGVPIVAEERYAHGDTSQPANRFILVDPLDGTKEFIKRSHEFTVNIAIIENGAPVVGMVIAPALGKAYIASGNRAWIGDMDPKGTEIRRLQKLSVRPAPKHPVAVASRSHSTPETDRAIELAGARDRRSIGSSLKFCLVASGEADFYPRMGPTMEWDTAAGDAVLRAAGGQVRTLSGDPLTYGKANVAGMRPFENPYFLAAGDRKLLERIGARLAA